MNNDNDDGVISLESFRKNRDTPPVEKPQPVPHTYEFHLLTGEEGAPDEVVQATGFLKFGPQFLVVVADYQEAAEVMLSVQLPLVKYVKRLEDNAVTGTLDLG